MRKLIAVISILATAFTVLVFGLVLAGRGHVTTPRQRRRPARSAPRSSETGGFDDSTFDHCSWFGGVRRRHPAPADQLGRRGRGRAVLEHRRRAQRHASTPTATPTAATRSAAPSTIRKNGGFLGLGCSNEHRDSNVSVTIDNITAISLGGATRRPRRTPRSRSRRR